MSLTIVAYDMSLPTRHVGIGARRWGRARGTRDGGTHDDYDGNDDSCPRSIARAAARHRRLVAGGQLSERRPDLPEGQPAAARAAGARPHQAPLTRPLG